MTVLASLLENSAYVLSWFFPPSRVFSLFMVCCGDGGCWSIEAVRVVVQRAYFRITFGSVFGDVPKPTTWAMVVNKFSTEILFYEFPRGLGLVCKFKKCKMIWRTSSQLHEAKWIQKHSLDDFTRFSSWKRSVRRVVLYSVHGSSPLSCSWRSWRSTSDLSERKT